MIVIALVLTADLSSITPSILLRRVHSFHSPPIHPLVNQSDQVFFHSPFRPSIQPSVHSPVCAFVRSTILIHSSLSIFSKILPPIHSFISPQFIPFIPSIQPSIQPFIHPSIHSRTPPYSFTQGSFLPESSDKLLLINPFAFPSIRTKTPLQHFHLSASRSINASVMFPLSGHEMRGKLPPFQARERAERLVYWKASSIDVNGVISYPSTSLFISRTRRRRSLLSAGNCNLTLLSAIDQALFPPPCFYFHRSVASAPPIHHRGFNTFDHQSLFIFYSVARPFLV